ncbi:hypothetical protein [Pseudanabaena sp. FACHB-2040]|uniref:hypothetical protein n=1 Tax=Pseudanabaena sp. FACHB-2040 TaxID=2692859 RepID=UPI0016898C89|nr:hypothetical protein [Pseudanabaena sp. FACHB-2040]MBD2260968.1 hypothetical protein [Pseudanabaena sp. FACHB-2040]
MSYDVSQWLAEIRTLQRQLADTQKERDQAYASAANWRRLYETEARQRRTESEALRSHLQTLEAELKQLKDSPTGAGPTDLVAAQGETAAGDALETKLQKTLNLCQSLTQQLKAEKEAHEQTRQSLTTALGDTFDMLKAEQASSAIVKAGQGAERDRS